MAKAKRLKEYEAWSRSIQGQEIPNLVSYAKFLAGPIGTSDALVPDDKPTFRAISPHDLPSDVFYFGVGFTYDAAVVGYESLKIGSNSVRFVTVYGRDPTSQNSRILANSALDVESSSGKPIKIGDCVGAFGGVSVTVDPINVAISIASPAGTVTIDSASVDLTGTLSLPAAALISSPTVTAKALRSTIPAGTGIIPTVQMICPSATRTLADINTAQNVFGAGFDSFTVAALTSYVFEGVYIFLHTGTVSRSVAISFLLTTATVTNCTFESISFASGGSGSVASGQSTVFYNTVAGGTVTAGIASTTHHTIKFSGIMRVNTGGTVTPKLTFSAAPGGSPHTLQVGSYLRFHPIGSNTINSVGTAIA